MEAGCSGVLLTPICTRSDAAESPCSYRAVTVLRTTFESRAELIHAPKNSCRDTHPSNMKINPTRTKAGWRQAARRHMCLHENGSDLCTGLLLEAGPCILCGEDRCIGSRGWASGRLRRYSSGDSFIYESHMHEHSTLSRVYPRWRG